MDVKSTALVIAGLIGFGIFAADVGARSQGAPGAHWVLESGGPNEVWKMNARTGELFYCITAQAQPKVVCSK